MGAIQIFGLVIGSIVSIGILISGFGYAFAQFKKGSETAENDAVKAQERTEKIYKELIDAQEIRFQSLEADHRVNLQKISKLEGVVEESAKQRRWFEEIFVAALEQYFDSNPQLANSMSSKLKTVRARH